MQSTGVLVRILHDKCLHGTRSPVGKLLESIIEDLNRPEMITFEYRECGVRRRGWPTLQSYIGQRSVGAYELI